MAVLKSFVELFVLTVFCLSSVSSTLTSTGTTALFNDVYYFIPPYPVGTLPDLSLAGTISVGGLVPMTVIAETFSTDEFDGLVANYTAKDDVFQAGFLQVVHTASAIDASSTSSYGILSVISGATAIPSGPYFISEYTGTIYEAYRLYSDFAGAFTEPLLETPAGDFTFLSANIPGSASLTVGVPSRLYYTPTAEKPLAGVRVGVKDIYDIAGVKTSDGNRAYYNLYPPRNATALAVQKLIDAGAIIIGKQKTSQFANGQEATADWVDYHSPFNPRGDGYQDPSSSSAGAGASIGTYPWMDLAIGSDTGGSIRGPSEVQGLFGNRPSHGLVALTGVMPLAPELDTAGFITRDPYLWGTAQEVLYDGLKTGFPYPKKIYTFEFPTSVSDASDSILLGFVNKLAKYLSATTSDINLTSLWIETGPKNTTSDLDNLLNITYPILIAQDQVRLVRKPFYADYGAIHDGRIPFVDPAPLIRWGFGDSFPDSATEEAINNKTLFMNWFQSHVVKSDPVTCSESFFLYVGSQVDVEDVNERNQYAGPPSVPYGFSSGRIAVFSEVPDSVFPIGQASFFSNITMHMEFLPVTVDILVAKGCDSLIYSLAQDLVKAGILSVPLTGQTIEGGGEVLLKRSTHNQ